MAKIRRIFPGGNTSQGFFSLHNNIIGENRKQLYILKGMPGGGKSSLMNDIADRMIESGYSIEYHHCPSDPKSVDAIVIEELQICIIDGTPPHSFDPIYPGLTDQIVDLAKFIDTDILKEKAEAIIQAKKKNKYAYRKAFNYLRAAKVVFDEIVESNKLMVDTKEVNRETKILIEKIFSKKPCDIDDNGFKERYLFSTAITPDGLVDYTNSILEWVSDVYYISGDIGTGKSTMLNRIIEEARMKDYHMEIYYDSLIPNRVESVFIKELDTIVTSNKNGDNFAEIKLDLNKYFDNSKINQEDYRIFNLLLDKGIQSLNGAKDNHFILESSYRPSVDYTGVSKIKEEIFNEILGYGKDGGNPNGNF